MSAFVKQVYDYYHTHQRLLPWRDAVNPYRVLVSEFMLQQTQVSRVIEKFNVWMATFPTIFDLASAPFAKVLALWSGLGYNRRAKYIHKASQVLVQKQNGIIPNDLDFLVSVPGIGSATAQAIRCYSFNEPVVFIETNIRTVYIHHFFRENSLVQDKELLPIINKTLDRKNPREWYWALMDYGSYLKSTFKNPARKSKHYVKQSRFEGSLRQIRGKMLSEIIKKGALAYPKKSIEKRAADSLIKDGLAKLSNSFLTIQNE